MTDITELAQSLKAAAEKAGADYWQAKKISGDFYVIRKGSYKRECGYTTYQPIAEIDHKPTRDYVALVNPVNILALVEALEKAQRYIEELREWNAGLAQESCERQQRISELLQGKVGSALLERENHHVEVVGKLTKVITELESEVEKWKQEAETWEHVAEKQLATAIELESRTVKLPPKVDSSNVPFAGNAWNCCLDEVEKRITAAGIKVEVE
ncbi:ead/Ea22-like family protein [Klebsiella pneumoniae]|nr:ead/Ea22-like family protein [Klebsiella pneumoniae]